MACELWQNKTIEKIHSVALELVVHLRTRETFSQFKYNHVN